MRKKLGDWSKVLQLLKTSSGAKRIAEPDPEMLENDLLAAKSGAGTDVQLEEAYNEIGEYYSERQRWDIAIKYYILGRNLAKQMECYYILEDYDNLVKVLEQLSENSDLLPVSYFCFI
jgi:WD repeat-containing protein 35